MMTAKISSLTGSVRNARVAIRTAKAILVDSFMVSPDWGELGHISS